MKLNNTTLAASIVMALGICQGASAHTGFVVDATSIPIAGNSYTGTIRGGHGCEDDLGNAFDTVRLEVSIPAGVTGVKPYDAPWGKATLEKDVGGNVTKLIWTKSGEPLPEDTHLYNVTFRARLPNAPLTSVVFNTVHFCLNSSNQEISHEWIDTDGPTLNLVPARSPGWNKYTAGVEVPDVTALKKFFGDAYIVWSNGAAYSANTETDKLIAADKKLTKIPANQEFWVKY